MKKLVVSVFAAMCVWLCVAAAGDAASLKRVYLRDGGIIECQSFFKKDGRIVVVVNRDVVLDFSPDEVQMKRTFVFQAASPQAARAVKKEEPVPAKVATAASTPATVKPAAPAANTQKPAPTANAQPPAAPAANTQKPAAPAANAQQPAAKPPAAAPASPPVRKTLPLAQAKPVDPVSTIMAGAAGMGVLAAVLLVVVVLIASFWKVFTKAGEAGWKSIIPVYNMFVLVKIAGKPWWWFLLLCIPVINVGIGILVSVELAKKFNQGLVFGLGLALLGFIFFPILAFGPAKYGQPSPLRRDALMEDDFQFD